MHWAKIGVKRKAEPEGDLSNTYERGETRAGRWSSKGWLRKKRKEER